MRPHRRQPTRLPIPGILQARTLEWVAISFSNAWKWKVKVKLLSRVWLFTTPWTAAHQAPLPMGFSRQEYWSGMPLTTTKYMNFRLVLILLIVHQIIDNWQWLPKWEDNFLSLLVIYFSCNKYLLSTYCAQGTVLGSTFAMMNKHRSRPHLRTVQVALLQWNIHNITFVM